MAVSKREYVFSLSEKNTQRRVVVVLVALDRVAR